MTEAPFDFRSPPLTAAEQGACEWLEAAARQSARSAARLDWKLIEIRKSPVQAALGNLSDHQLGFALEMDNYPVCLVVPRTLVLWLLLQALGEPLQQLPPDRELTAVERDSLDYLIPQLLDPMRAVWPASVPPVVRLVEKGRPMVICRLDFDRPALLARLQPTWTSEAEILFLFPTELPFRVMRVSDRKDGFDRALLESAVRQLPVEFAVNLGTARLDFDQLRRLNPGDVVVLDQAVSAPLSATLSGLPRFHVWPGVIGGEVAVRIAADMAESS